MNVRYQDDADLNQVIVTGVLRREPTVDFQTATAAGLEGVKDLEVLAIAARQKRILVTHGRETRAFGDRKTMPLEFAKFIVLKAKTNVVYPLDVGVATERRRHNLWLAIYFLIVS